MKRRSIIERTALLYLWHAPGPKNLLWNRYADQAGDQRVFTDFEYTPVIPFLPNRGYYHFSNFSDTVIECVCVSLRVSYEIAERALEPPTSLVQSSAIYP